VTEVRRISPPRWRSRRMRPTCGHYRTLSRNESGHLRGCVRPKSPAESEPGRPVCRCSKSPGSVGHCRGLCCESRGHMRVPYPAMLALAGGCVRALPFAPHLSIEPRLAFGLVRGSGRHGHRLDMPPREMLRIWLPLPSLAGGAGVADDGAVAWPAGARGDCPCGCGRSRHRRAARCRARRPGLRRDSTCRAVPLAVLQARAC